MTAQFVAYTDGACRGNPGPGGWGVVFETPGNLPRLSGGERITTNNRMELLAAISAVEATPEAATVIVVTDSKYVQEGITSWITGWKARDWKTKSNTPVKNVDLWKRLDAACALRRVSVKWVRGHAGNHFNELADQLAVGATPE